MFEEGCSERCTQGKEVKKENNEVIEEENILERLQKLEKAVNEIIDVLNGVTKE